jgi:geranylgeranyl diphosphate synthase type II
MERIDQTLAASLLQGEMHGSPPKLAAAMQYAVFPGGARIRPRLCLAVGQACGADRPRLVDAAAAAIELLHCASLVHDDLPCFDDAATRRGRPSVHARFGERLAVLAGDALIVMAFQTLADHAAQVPERLACLLLTIARSVGMPAGIVAGQAWECESRVVLAEYQRAKTGALFSAATVAGAQAAGVDPGPWQALGEYLGEAYQVADDIRDLVGSAEDLGKPVGRDALLGRPSAALELGLEGALQHFEALVAKAIGSIPPCPGASQLRDLMRSEVQRLLPREYACAAA